MSNVRPNSQSSRSRSAQKPGFQTKLKPRLRGQLDLTQLNESEETSRMAMTQRSLHNHQDCLKNEDIFNKTASKLSNTNFSHHNHENCLCN
jgi:hypothetical protein